MREAIKSKATADEHLADQLIPFMALLPTSTITTTKVTNHTTTNIWVCEKFLPTTFVIEQNTITTQ